MTKDILGHARQRAEINRLIAEERLPHTLLFSGPPGIGKQLAAKEAAEALLCSNKKGSPERLGGCGECGGCRTLISGNNPDFHYIDCADNETGGTAQIRDLLFLLNLKSFSSGARVVVFNNADELQTQAANALLKTFEEPRPNTYLILVASSRSKLPPTLVSRCQIWFFDSLSPGEMTDAAQGVDALRTLRDDNPDGFRESLLTANGSMESFAALADHIEWWLDAKGAIDRAAAGDYLAALELAKEIAQEKGTLQARLRIISAYVRRLMRESADDARRLKYSLALSNFLEADRLIMDRNLAAAPVLFLAMTPMLRGYPADLFNNLPHDKTLLEEIVV